MRLREESSLLTSLNVDLPVKLLFLIILKDQTGMTGTVSPLYEPAMLLKRAGVVPGHDLTSEAALAKLSYLLALPELNVEDVTHQMSISLRGELTEHTRMAFEHPNDYLPQHLTDLAAISYAIAKGNVPELQEVVKTGMEWLLNEADYSGNTPLVRPRIDRFPLLHQADSTSQHIAATGPSLEVLRILLSKGASVHLRNKTGRTPLFLAANAQLAEHVCLLRESGAHLHADELDIARLLAQQGPSTWQAAGA